MRITIDPGHTKNTNKGVINGYYEGNAMYKLANFLKEELLSFQDTEVFITRTEGGDPSLFERGNLAITNSSKVFISLHSNATSESESASYVCGFYSVKRSDSKDLCTKLVSAVTNVMKEATSTRNRGALTKKTSGGVDYYGVIRNAVSGSNVVEHAFIIEHGFHTNKKQCEFLMSDENLKKIAKAEAETLAQYFGLEKKEPFLPSRKEIPDGTDLFNLIEPNKYYFSGLTGKVTGQPLAELEQESFMLDVDTCLYQGIPYVVQKIYYFTSGKEYIRGIYVKNNKSDEIHREWSKK